MTQEERNPFLEHQKRILEQRAMLQAERQAKLESAKIPAGVSEAPSEPIFGDPNTIKVERYNPVTGETQVRRVDVSRPAPQRIVKPAPLTLEEIKTSLIEAGNEIDAAREKFETDDASLDTFYAEQKTLRAEIAELQAKLREKQNRLDELETAGSPRDIYAASIVALERQLAGYAGALLAALSEAAAQRIFGVSFDDLSKDSQRDVQARYRKQLARFQSNFYMQIGRTHATATADKVEQRASQLLDDISGLLDSEYFAE
jgi:hypothetical protein